MTLKKLISVSYLSIYVLSVFLAVLAPRTLAFAAPLLGMLTLVGFSLFPIGRGEIVTYLAAYKAYVFLLVGVMGLAGISLLWTVSFEESMERLVKTLPIVGFGFFLPLAWRQIDVRDLMIALTAVLSGLVFGLLFIGEELLFKMPYYRYVKGYNATEWFHPSFLNRQTVFMCLMFFLVYPLVFYIREIPFRWFFLFALPGLLAGVLWMTESQGCQMAFLLGLLAFFAFPHQWRSAWMILKSILVICVFAAPWIAFAGFDILPGHMKEYAWTQNGYAAERLEIWNFISTRIMENPLYGFGIESTSVMEFDTDRLYHADSTVLHPHNAVLQFWIEFGVVGAGWVAFFLWMTLTFIQKIEIEWQRRSLLAFFMATLVIAATGYGVWQGWWLGLLLMGAGIVSLGNELLKHGFKEKAEDEIL